MFREFRSTLDFQQKLDIEFVIVESVNTSDAEVDFEELFVDMELDEMERNYARFFVKEMGLGMND